ncbi:MAG: GrpE [Bacteroidetes bacterium]|nr:GrpE [Bacteroidota bacterium]
MKKNKIPLYTLLSQNIHSINKLYECLNVSKPNWKMNLPDKLSLLIENIFVSNVTSDNLKGITQLINGATKIAEDKMLAVNNYEKTNERITEELKVKRQEIQDLKVKIENNNNSKPTKEDLNEEINELEKKIMQQYITFVNEIIHMRDNLCMKEEMLKLDDNYQKSTSWKLIQNLFRETENILNRMGITVINQTGTFENNKQMVTDTVSTDCEELDKTVAQTFREGYRTVDKLIRPQEVILYSYKR